MYVYADGTTTFSSSDKPEAINDRCQLGFDLGSIGASWSSVNKLSLKSQQLSFWSIEQFLRTLVVKQLSSW